MTVELLFTLLNSVDDITKLKLSEEQERYSYRYIYNGKPYSIDLYRLVHFCKVFAQSHKYNLGSGYDNEYGWYAFYSIDSIMDEAVYIMADTEALAVFEATQRILKEVMKNDSDV